MRIALGVEYAGTAYCGWQSQPNAQAVQDKLEAALAKIACVPIRTHCAGRTDARVHALHQVVHFDAPVERALSAWIRGVNAHLPDDIAVLWAVEVGEEFHARFAARARSYRYLLLNRPVRPGWQANRVGWYHAPLDVKAMQEASSFLLGEHDFSAFRAAECQAKSPIKTLHRAQIESAGELLSFEFEANAFLHHMVRNLVGALVYVGKGKHGPEWVAELLHQGERALAAPTFSPDGLYFAGADYDPKWQLPGNGRIIAPPIAGLSLKP